MCRNGSNGGWRCPSRIQMASAWTHGRMHAHTHSGWPPSYPHPMKTMCGPEVGRVEGSLLKPDVQPAQVWLLSLTHSARTLSTSQFSPTSSKRLTLTKKHMKSPPCFFSLTIFSAVSCSLLIVRQSTHSKKRNNPQLSPEGKEFHSFSSCIGMNEENRRVPLRRQRGGNDKMRHHQLCLRWQVISAVCRLFVVLVLACELFIVFSQFCACICAACVCVCTCACTCAYTFAFLFWKTQHCVVSRRSQSWFQTAVELGSAGSMLRWLWWQSSSVT